MMDKPLEEVYSLVERAYVRMQAGDILIRCLEESSSTPIQELVEELVIAGSRSLDALREILAEAGQRKSQVQDDIHQVAAELKKVLKSFGVHLGEFEEAEAVLTLTPFSVLTILRQQGINDSQTQADCLKVFQDSRELVSNLDTNFKVLAEVEAYLQDWSWGLAYQIARQSSSRGEPTADHQ